MLANDLFSASSKLRYPIEMVHIDGSQSPVMDSASSSESADNQMPATSDEQTVEHFELAIPSEQAVEHVELSTSNDHIAETGVTVVESEMTTPSSHLINIAAVARSQSRKKGV